MWLHKVITLCILTGLGCESAFASQPNNIHFDISPFAVAEETPTPESTYIPPNHRWVTITLNISALIDSTSRTKPHEFLYHIACRNDDVQVVGYSPSTKLQTTTNGGISVERMAERSKSVGVHLHSLYHGIANADAALDSQTRSNDKTKYERVAPP